MGLKGIYSFSLIMLSTVPRRAKRHCTIRQSKLQILNSDRQRSHTERQKVKRKEIQHDSGKKKELDKKKVYTVNNCKHKKHKEYMRKSLLFLDLTGKTHEVKEMCEELIRT